MITIILPLLGLASMIFRKQIYFPAKGKISSGYGNRNFKDRVDLHTGIDIAAPLKSTVLASLDGKVLGTFPNISLKNYGNAVVIKHNDTLFSLYAHLDKIKVAKNQEILAGDIIGTVGTTAGNKQEPNRKVPAHLHFEFLSKWPPSGKDMDRINPVSVFEILKESGVEVV